MLLQNSVITNNVNFYMKIEILCLYCL